METKEWAPIEPGAVEHQRYCSEDGNIAWRRRRATTAC